MGLVVDGEDVLHPHQLGHHPLQHLSFGLQRLQRCAIAALQQQAPALGQRHALAQLEGVVVGDDDAGAAELGQQIGRDQFAAGVVAVGIVGQQHPQAVADGDARRDDEEAAGEALAVGVADGVDRLPGDQHRHHGGLAGAGGELERDAQQLRVGLGVGVGEVLDEALAVLARVRCDFGEPDRGLDCLDLAEKGPDAGKFVLPPVPQQACGLRRHPPLGLGQRTPLVDLGPHRVDGGGMVVLLGFRGKPGALIEDQRGLQAGAFALPRLGDRGDEFGAAAAIDDALCRLTLLVKFPMSLRVGVGRIEDRVFEECVAHACWPVPRCATQPVMPSDRGGNASAEWPALCHAPALPRPPKRHHGSTRLIDSTSPLCIGA